MKENDELIVEKKEEKKERTHRSLEDVLAGERLEPGNVIKTFKDMLHFISKCDVVDLGQLFWRMILVAGIILLMGLPFVLVRELGPDILAMFNIFGSDRATIIWSAICTSLYLIIAIVAFYFTMKKRFYNLVNKVDDGSNITKEKVIDTVNNTFNTVVNKVDDFSDKLNNRTDLDAELEVNKGDFNKPLTQEQFVNGSQENSISKTDQGIGESQVIGMSSMINLQNNIQNTLVEQQIEMPQNIQNNNVIGNVDSNQSTVVNDMNNNSDINNNGITK